MTQVLAAPVPGPVSPAPVPYQPARRLGPARAKTAAAPAPAVEARVAVPILRASARPQQQARRVGARPAGAECDQAVEDRILADRQPRAGAAPRLHGVRIAARALRAPGEELERQGVGGIGHGVLAGSEW